MRRVLALPESYRARSLARYLLAARPVHTYNASTMPVQCQYNASTMPVQCPQVRTTREVAAGEELLLDYGSDYWDRSGLAYPNPRRLAIDFL